MADIASQIIDCLVEIARPLVAQWWQPQALPAIAAKREDLMLKQQARKAQKKALRAGSTTASPVADRALEAESPSQEVAAASGDPKVTVTREQFQQMFMTWLTLEEAQQALWNLIVNAEVEDGDAANMAWQQELMELSPEQRAERVLEFFSANPSTLESFARQFMGSMVLGLGEPVLRREQLLLLLSAIALWRLRVALTRNPACAI